MFTHTIDHTRYEWSGGAYIEIFQVGNETPYDVINVWDYVLDMPRIEKTQEAFIHKCERYHTAYLAENY